MTIISREEARQRGLTHYFTNQPCKHGHIEKRFVKNGSCIKCREIFNRKDYLEKRHKICKIKTRPYKQHAKRWDYKIGDKINNIEIIEISDIRLTEGKKQSYTTWWCQCHCGKKFLTTARNLRRGQKSCGCLSECNRFQRLPSDKAILHKYIFRYKQGAARRNIVWNLPEEQFEKLIKSNCHYCGEPPSLKVSTVFHEMKVNGVDRRNNEKYYSVDNTVSCCTICNRAKSTLPEKEFKEWIKRIKLYNENSGSI